MGCFQQQQTSRDLTYSAWQVCSVLPRPERMDWACWHSKHLTTHLYKLCCLAGAHTSMKPGFQSPNWSLSDPLLTHRVKISLQLPWQPLWSTTFAATRKKPAFDIFKIEESIEFKPSNPDEPYKNTSVSQPTDVFHSKHICWQGE